MGGTLIVPFGGGSQTDFGARGDYWLRHVLEFSASMQYERWLFPVIQPGPETNVSDSIEVQFQPQKSPGLILMVHSATDAGAGGGRTLSHTESNRSQG